MSYQNPQIPNQNMPPGPMLVGTQYQPQQQPPQLQQHNQTQHQPMSNNLPNGPTMPPTYSTGLKQQYLPPQIHTNGLDHSPAMNQPLNAAYLPPTPAMSMSTTSASIQRPNLYATSNAPASAAPPPISAAAVATTGVKPMSLPPQSHPITNQQIPAPMAQTRSSAVPPQPPSISSQSITTAAAPPPPTVAASALNASTTAPAPAPINNMNYYQSPPASIAKPGATATSQPPLLPPTINTSTSTPNTQNLDRITSNLQNVHLNNGNGILSPTNAPPLYNQTAGSHSPQANLANRLTNGNSMQSQPSPTIPGYNNSTGNMLPPPKSVAAPPPSQGLPKNPNQAAMGGLQQQQPPMMPPPQFNGTSPAPVANKFPPPMNQQPPVSAPPQQQQQQQQQYRQSVQPPPQIPTQPQPQQMQFNATQSSTIGKRPLYPTQQQQPPQQQQQPMQQQQQHLHNQPPPMPNQQHQFNNTNTTNMAYNQYQTPPVPQNYPTPAMQPTPAYNNSAYAQQPQPQQPYGTNNVVQRGFDSMWGHNTIDLMQHRHILPPVPVEPPKISLEHQFYESVNCSPDIFRCTLTRIPESNALLQKSRLPLGILIHPFRDLNNLPVIQCSTIVRCRSCRTYINPFVYFVDSKKWKCNLCFRINELPDEFQYDPVSKSYGDVTRRPEVKSSTIEFIAPSEYMLRPPQPAIYLFLLDVSMIAQQSGYLRCVCEALAEHLDTLPGDVRAQIGFVAYNSAVHFYSLAEGFNQPHEITVVDIDDPFLPCPDNLLINLNECKELIKDLLQQLPNRFANSHDSNSALGAALQVAYKLMQQTGGRVTVFQTCLPNVGPGALQSRENPNERSAKEIQHLGPATDYYKRHALECSGQQIAVDLFLMNSQYSDLATISGISKFSGGCIHHFPLFNAAKPQQVDAFKRCFERYLTRKIGFESVMRIRCTRGLTIHTFHGNFFVRSTDLLSLPNVNPDAGYGMQISYEENLGESKTVCFQAALLYTSSKGERRIRVHTLCLPISNCLTDIIHSADAQAIIGLISKMAVDRSLQSSISDARDAFINASCDIFSAFHLAQNIKSMNSQLVAPMNLSLLPLYMLALLKHPAFRTGTSTRLDDRVFAMCELKTLPLDQLIRFIYPDLYHLDCLFSENNNETSADDSNGERPDPPLLQLSAEHLKSRSVFLLDCGTMLLLLVGSSVPATILKNVFGVQHVNEIPDLCYELPNTRTTDCDNLHSFLEAINVEKPYTPPIQIIRDNSPYRSMFIEKLVDDRSESSLSYYEFLQHLRTQVK